MNELKLHCAAELKGSFFLGMEVHSPLLYRRKSFKFEDYSKFKISSKNFDQQYFHIYNERLKALNDHLLQKAKAKWGKYWLKVKFVARMDYII